MKVRRTVAVSRSNGDDIFVLAMAGGSIALEQSVVTTGRCAALNAGRSHRYAETAMDTSVIQVHSSEFDNFGTYWPSTKMGVMGGATLDIQESTIRNAATLGLSISESGSRGTTQQCCHTAWHPLFRCKTWLRATCTGVLVQAAVRALAGGIIAIRAIHQRTQAAFLRSRAVHGKTGASNIGFGPSCVRATDGIWIRDFITFVRIWRRGHEVRARFTATKDGTGTLRDIRWSSETITSTLAVNAAVDSFIVDERDRAA